MKKQDISSIVSNIFKFLKEIAVLLIPLRKKQKILLMRLKPYLSNSEIRKVKWKLKQKKAEIRVLRKGFSFLICSQDIMPKIVSDEEKINYLNKKIEEKFWDEAIKSFSKRAWQAIPEYIAPNTLGLKHIKQAISLVLASDKKMSLLLVGNPSVDKAEFVLNTKELKKKSQVFSRSLKNAEKKDLLLMDEIGDYTKSTYKKIKEFYLKNDVSMIASASFKNELYDKIPKNFVGKLKMPSNFAYMFDMIFLIKSIDKKRFEELAESIASAKKVEINKKDVRFIRKYLDNLSKKDVSVSKDLTKKVKDFSVYLKKNEEKFAKPVDEKMVRTLMKLIRASAWLEKREKVEEKDLDRVFDIFRKSLE